MAKSWIVVWMGIELNFLFFLVIIRIQDFVKSEVRLKYFLIQSCGSIVFLFSFFFLSKHFLRDVFLKIAILLKLGIVPLHLWVFSIVLELDWGIFFLFSSFQKIIPINILYYLEGRGKVSFYIVLILGVLIRGVGGINEFSLRKLLSYSSISYVTWILCLTMEDKGEWLLNFVVYRVVLLRIIYVFEYIGIYHINQFFFLKNSKVMIVMFYIRFLSIGGIPPFLGFFLNDFCWWKFLINYPCFVSTLYL